MKMNAICFVLAMSAFLWIEQPAIARNPLLDDPLFQLVQAVGGNETNTLRNLIEKGVDVNQHFGAIGESALFRARRADIAQILLDAGADPAATNIWGATPFQFAAATGHKEVAELLLKMAGHYDARDALGRTALLMAAREESKEGEDIALWLLEMGADPNVMAKDGKETVMVNAVWTGKARLLRALVERGVKVAGTGLKNISPLHMAVMIGDPQTVSLLINGGSEIDSFDDDGLTPLLYCVTRPWGDHAAIVDLLVGAGADISKTDRTGRTLMDLAQSRLERAEKNDGEAKEVHDANLRNAKKLLIAVKRHTEKRKLK